VRVLAVPSGDVQVVGDLALRQPAVVGELDYLALVGADALERAMHAPRGVRSSRRARPVTARRTAARGLLRAARSGRGCDRRSHCARRRTATGRRRLAPVCRSWPSARWPRRSPERRLRRSSCRPGGAAPVRKPSATSGGTGLRRRWHRGGQSAGIRSPSLTAGSSDGTAPVEPLLRASRGKAVLATQLDAHLFWILYASPRPSDLQHKRPPNLYRAGV
jgi:hypothetical protein